LIDNKKKRITLSKKMVLDSLSKHTLKAAWLWMNLLNMFLKNMEMI
jgi:hypothetical protein